MQNLLKEVEKNQRYRTFFEKLKQDYLEFLNNGLEKRDYFANFDFFSSFGFFVEPLQAFPTVNSYYQYFYINGVKQPTNWAKGMSALFFSEGFVSFIFCRVISSEGRRMFSKFYAIKLKPKVEVSNETLAITFDSKVNLENLSTKEKVEKSLKFSFIDSTFENSYLSLREAKNDSLLKKIGKYGTKAFLLSLEFDFAPTKPFFKPYWISENYREFGFSSRLELQKKFKEVLKATIRQTYKGCSTLE